MSLATDIGIVLLLIFLNGLFAMAELAIVSARRSRLRQLADEGHRGAKLTLAMANDPVSFLSIVQVGVTLNGVLAGAFSGATIAGYFTDYFNSFAFIAPHGEGVAMGVTVAAVTYLSLVFGELIPKRIGLTYAEPIAVRMAYLMHACAFVAAPLVWILRQSTNLTIRILHLKAEREADVTEEEVKDMIAEGAVSGAIKPAERDMMEGVMRLADRTVRSIMTPRIEMEWLDIDDTVKDNNRVMRECAYSRFPLARGDLEEVIGIVHAKDLLNASLDNKPLSLKAMARAALIVPDTTTVLRLLDQFKQTGQQLAIVADEYGSVEGIVSASDILQSITGDIPESGQEGTTPPVKRDDGSWLIDGSMPIDEVENLLGLKAMQGEGDFHTLAGFVIERLGHLPHAGDHFVWDETHFEVVDMDGRRVDKVIVTPASTAGQES